MFAHQVFEFDSISAHYDQVRQSVNDKISGSPEMGRMDSKNDMVAVALATSDEN